MIVEFVKTTNVQNGEEQQGEGGQELGEGPVHQHHPGRQPGGHLLDEGAAMKERVRIMIMGTVRYQHNTLNSYVGLCH